MLICVAVLLAGGRKLQVSQSVKAGTASCGACRFTSASAQSGVTVQGPACWVLEVLKLPIPGPVRLQLPTISRHNPWVYLHNKIVAKVSLGDGLV